ncbi:hypothetical protein C8Q80DRAFT_1264466 [Daedaleopsis nitida]|nr:hypothetical protein C8Q80DRAFT_1264466 [Daedaleopsis nitida]
MSTMPRTPPHTTILYDFTSAEQRKEALRSLGMVPASLSAPHRYRGARRCTRSHPTNDAACPTGPRSSGSKETQLQTRTVKTPRTVRLSPPPLWRVSNASFASSVTNASRQPVAPTTHTRESIKRLASLIDDEQSRWLTEVAYLC